jgi:hypothetical protein
LLAALTANVMGCAQYPRIELNKAGIDEAVYCQDNVVVSRQGQQIYYQGELTQQGLWAIERITKDRPVSTLVITSSGGEINTGMDFGDWVHEHGVSVVVDDSCLSSCANYVFTAAWQKTILPGALVAWHGSARQQDLPDQLASIVDHQIKSLALSRDRKEEERRKRQHDVSNYLTKSVERQDAFFNKIRVNEYVTRIGNERYGINGLYYLSVEHMAQFGILNVTAPADYDQTDVSSLLNRIGIPITHLKLGDSEPPATLHATTRMNREQQPPLGE